MSKLLLATLLIGMIGSCTKPILKKERKIIQAQIGYQFEIVTFDSCEYLIHLSSGNTVHKGNCSNPIHNGGEQ
jgi:hypothetical protein